MRLLMRSRIHNEEEKGFRVLLDIVPKALRHSHDDHLPLHS
jgi:hypothetical protein